MFPEYEISVILPIYNGSTTILKTLESLIKQRKYFKEIILVDDNSKDDSAKIAIKYLKKNNVTHNIIIHKKNLGLAKSYNQAIMQSTGNLILIIHQDILVLKNSFKRILAPFFKKNSNVVATYHINLLPKKIWAKYSFWQKCYFSRKVNTESKGLSGDFDCFKKESLVKVGYFDTKHFHSAGEDADIYYKLSKIGKIIQTQAKIIHLHKINKNFTYKDYIFKHMQFAETQGTLLWLGRLKSINLLIPAFFREILVILLFVPLINYLGIILIILYSILYSKNVFIYQYKDPRTLVLPLVNIYLLPISFFYSIKGFTYGKQTL